MSGFLKTKSRTFVLYFFAMDIALYRKYRPQSFAEALGQEHIVKALQEALKGGNITHAYLFYGSRGTGKTTFARILAREIGCLPEDLYEIDAASNRGIDEIRALRESVKTLPFRSPYKVYIIDEVHMLTKDAFNALLKTLEEPPKHVVFVLATTEFGKLPDTVVSRCQHFTFKKPSQKILKESVLSIAGKEGFSMDASSADLIATLGDGSFRDAQMALQKVLHSVSGKKITLDDVEKVSSAPSHVLVNELIGALAESNLGAGLAVVRKAAEQNIDFSLFVKLILKKVRFILLLRYAPDTKTFIGNELSPDDNAFVENMAKGGGKALNSGILLALLDVHAAIPRAYIPQLPLELALIKLLEEHTNASNM